MIFNPNIYTSKSPGGSSSGGGSGGGNTHTITFRDQGDNILQTIQVTDGQTPSYSGDTPSLNGWKFKGWQPALSPASGDTTYWADYEYPAGMSSTILKTWDEIIADADAGNNASYSELDTKIMVTTDNKPLCYELAGKDVDTLSDGGTASMSWISRTIDGKTGWSTYDTTLGYPESDYKTYIEGTCLNHFPANIKDALRSVSKTYRMGKNDSGATNTATHKIWPPSIREMNWTDTSEYNETNGVTYTAYTSNSQRIRYTDTGIMSDAWLRSAYYFNTSYTICITPAGNWNNINNCYTSYGALPCFCLGKTGGSWGDRPASG